MHRTLLLTVLAVVTAALPARAFGQTVREFTSQIANYEARLRKSADPVERKRYAEDIEKAKQQMGPVDANGVRVRCQAMWHDTALEVLDAEIKKTAGRTGTPGAAASLSTDARLAVRRMASICLTRGWRNADGKYKYQPDAFGAYLYNNLRTVDALCDTASAWAVKESRLPPDSEERPVYAAAMAKAKAGISKMILAAQSAAAPAKTMEAMETPLADFAAGLRLLREADLALAEQARKKPAAAGAGDAAGTPGEAVEPEPPPMTEAEGKRLARVQEVAAAIKEGKDDGWAPLGETLGKFAAAVEAGFQLSSARPKARELLDKLSVAVNLVESLRASKAAYPEYVKFRQGELAQALALIADPETRASGYLHIPAIWDDDALRRQLDLGKVSPAALQGLARACYAASLSRADVEDPTLRDLSREAREACRTLAGIFKSMKNWPPKDTAPKLAEAYARAETFFLGAVERAGTAAAAAAAPGGVMAPAVADLTQAAERGQDMDLIVRSDIVVKAVAKHRPARAAAMYAQVSGAADSLAGAGQTVLPTARQALQLLVKQFEDLSRFPMPEPEVAKAVTRLVPAFPAASAVASKELAAGIDAASTGDPAPLRQALDARFLFALLRMRAQAETAHLEKVGVTNLSTFSVPEKPWAAFVAATDQKMRTMFADYVKPGRGRPGVLRATGDWSTIYWAVAASQRLTLDGRIEGQAEVDALLRNLDNVAAPITTIRGWQPWAVGYHSVEAAAAMTAGFDSVADWHRTQMRVRTDIFTNVELYKKAR